MRHLLRAVGGSAATSRPSSGNAQQDRLIEKYVDHLEMNCGWASETRHYRARYAREFLECQFPKGLLKLNQMKPQDVAQFVANYAVRCKRSWAQVAASFSSELSRHTVPVGNSVSRELVRGVIRRAYKRSGCSPNWTGTHVLRHTRFRHFRFHFCRKSLCDGVGVSAAG